MSHPLLARCDCCALIDTTHRTWQGWPRCEMCRLMCSQTTWCEVRTLVLGSDDRVRDLAQLLEDDAEGAR